MKPVKESRHLGTGTARVVSDSGEVGSAAELLPDVGVLEASKEMLPGHDGSEEFGIRPRKRIERLG